MLPFKVEISHKTILFAIGVILASWLIYHVLDIIFFVFVAFIFMSAFRPTVELLESRKIPRLLAALMIYIVFLAFLAVLITLLLPPVVAESTHFLDTFPIFIKNAIPFAQVDITTITSQIAPISQNVVKVTLDVFTNIFTIFTILVVSFYMLLERKHLERYLEDLVGKTAGIKVFAVVEKVEERLGAWVRGQVMLGAFIGLLSGIALLILGLPYVLPLAILAAILELIPIIGPIISMIPAILIAATMSPLLALLTFLAYLIIQQVEAHVVVPIMMKKVVGLPPIVTVLALMIGGKLAGIVGVLLAVPILLTLLTIFTEYVLSKKTTIQK